MIKKNRIQNRGPALIPPCLNLAKVKTLKTESARRKVNPSRKSKVGFQKLNSLKEIYKEKLFKSEERLKLNSNLS